MTFYLEDLLLNRIGLGLTQEKMFWKLNKGIKEGVDEHIDKRLSRRDFLKGGLKLAGAAAIATSVPGFVQNAIAENFPAHYNSKDTISAIKMTYKIDPKAYDAYIYFKMYPNVNDNEYENAFQILRIIEPTKIRMNNLCQIDTPSLDPGYHHIACMIWTKMMKEGNYTQRMHGSSYRAQHGGNIKKLLDFNGKKSNMNHFGTSLKLYYNRWELGETEDLEQIERGFLNAIFSSLNLDLKNVEWYMSDSTPQEDREKYITSILPQIEKMKKGVDMKFPPASRNPNEPFYKLILMREASSMLIKHYVKTANYEKKKMMIFF